MAWPERFDTARCVVRKLLPYDAEALFAAFGNDEDAVRYLGWKPHRELADTRRQITYDLHRWDKGSAYTFVVIPRDDDRPAGLVQLLAQGHQARLGFLLARSRWGQGLTTEAVAPVLAAALAQPNLYRIDAVCDVDNPASARVLEKLGMAFEGRLRRYIVHPNISPEPRDVLLYASVR